MKDEKISIFKEYYSQHSFYDKFLKNQKEAMDIIIPIMHTNELWENNLISLYREIPINSLLIGDGGCIDNSIEIVKKFPRVKVFNHKKYKTLGFSIRKLIEEVKTEWFIYLHSDVYLPSGWFEKMKRYKNKYDWFGCPMQNTIMVDYPDANNFTRNRPFAGSQMGRKAAFINNLKNIEDDYVYRQEDFVFSDLVEKSGYKNGWINDTFHFHQTMYKQSKWERKIKRVILDIEMSPEEKFRTHYMQAKGFIKYTCPNKFLIKELQSELIFLYLRTDFDLKEFISYVKENNVAWLPYIKPSILYFYKIIYKILSVKIGKIPIHAKLKNLIIFFEKAHGVLFD